MNVLPFLCRRRLLLLRCCPVVVGVAAAAAGEPGGLEPPPPPDVTAGSVAATTTAGNGPGRGGAALGETVEVHGGQGAVVPAEAGAEGGVGGGARQHSSDMVELVWRGVVVEVGVGGGDGEGELGGGLCVYVGWRIRGGLSARSSLYKCNPIKQSTDLPLFTRLTIPSPSCPRSTPSIASLSARRHANGPPSASLEGIRSLWPLLLLLPPSAAATTDPCCCNKRNVSTAAASARRAPSCSCSCACSPNMNAADSAVVVARLGAEAKAAAAAAPPCPPARMRAGGCGSKEGVGAAALDDADDVPASIGPSRPSGAARRVRFLLLLRLGWW